MWIQHRTRPEAREKEVTGWDTEVTETLECSSIQLQTYDAQQPRVRRKGSSNESRGCGRDMRLPRAVGPLLVLMVREKLAGGGGR